MADEDFFCTKCGTDTYLLVETENGTYCQSCLKTRGEVQMSTKKKVVKKVKKAPVKKKVAK